jgi:hypothetical protein
MEVDVEVLDINDAEARALLLSIDPLAALAETQSQLHQRLIDLTPTDSTDLRAAWEATTPTNPPSPRFGGEGPGVRGGIDSIPEQYLILLTCRDEHQQVELLQRFTAEGLDCWALVS